MLSISFFNYIILSWISFIFIEKNIVVQSLIIKGTAHHINGYTSLTDSSFITLPICLGTPKQCFNLLYSNIRTFLFVCNTTLSNKVKTPFNEKESTTLDYLSDKPYTFKSSVLQLNGQQVQDYLELTPASKLKFITMNEINFNMVYFDGIIGFYKQHVLGQSFSFLYTLYNNDIISNMNFGQIYTSKKKVDIIIGEQPSNIDKYSFCSSRQQSFWYCKLESVSFYGNDTIIRSYKSDVIIDTAGSSMYAPSPYGFDLFQLYTTASGKHCTVNKNSANEHYLQCDKNANITLFPDIVLTLEKVKLILKAVDVFDQLSDGGLHGKIFIKEYGAVWVLNQVVLKNYDIYFDDDNYKIGFKENHVFDNYNGGNDASDDEENGIKWIVIVLLLLCICGAGFTILLFCYKKKVLNKGLKKTTNKDIEDMPYKVVLSQNLMSDIK